MNEIIKNGTMVTISNGEIKAVVTACCIRGLEPSLRVEYEVEWFVGGSCHSKWMEDFLVTPFVDVKKKAGLVNYSTEIELKQ